jgi:hypothetical protein
MAGDLVVRIVGENSSLKQTMREGAQITREFMTEQEQNSQQLQRIGKLYEAGAISAETLSRAVAKITAAENASGKAALIAEEKMLTEIRVAAAQERAAAAQREMKAEQELTNRKLEMDQRLAASQQMAMDRRMARVVGAQLEQQSMERTAGGTRNLTFAVQQLAFGAQDAATVFGTMGFGGAVRAASNNIIQFASLISPLAGTIAAVAGTGIALFVDSMFKTEHQTKKTEEKVRNLADAFGDLSKRIAEIPQTGENFRQQEDRLNKMSNPEDIRDQIEEFKAQTRDNVDAIAQRKSILDKSFKDIRRNDQDIRLEKDTQTDGWEGRVKKMEEENKGIEEAQKEQRALIKKHQQELFEINRRQVGLQKRLPGVQGSAEDEFDRQQRKKSAEEGKKLEESFRTPAEKMDEELDRLEQLREKGVINVDTFDRAMGKARKDFEDAMERADPLRQDKQFAKQLAEKVKLPQEKFADERSKVDDLRSKNLISAELADKALRDINYRESEYFKMDDDKKKKGQVVNKEENKALNAGSTEAYKAIIQAQKQNEPLAQILEAQRNAAKIAKDAFEEQKRANRVAENQKFLVVDNFM